MTHQTYSIVIVNIFIHFTKYIYFQKYLYISPHSTDLQIVIIQFKSIFTFHHIVLLYSQWYFIKLFSTGYYHTVKSISSYFFLQGAIVRSKIFLCIFIYVYFRCYSTVKSTSLYFSLQPPAVVSAVLRPSYRKRSVISIPKISFHLIFLSF